MIIIPARLASTRLPNKVLALIGNLPMVIKTAKAVSMLDDVVIATDSPKVVEVVNSYNFKAILTSTNHNSGTDRVYEAAKKLHLKKNEIIINLQADEPFIEKEVVEKLIELTKKVATNKEIIATSCYKKVSKEIAKDENIVKVVTSKDDIALYFSRSLIPFSRDKKLGFYKAHLGLYGYTLEKLEEFCNMKSIFSEDIEKLEQLRILENNKKIALVKVDSISFGIDTINDLKRANKRYEKQNKIN